MALDHVPVEERGDQCTNTHLRDLYVGVDLTRHSLLKTFKNFGVEPFDPMGEKFDPNFHTALFQAPFEEEEEGRVFKVLKVGYMINERVLRSAQVGVVKK